MVESQIIAVTVQGDARLEHITHYWTAPGTFVEKHVAVKQAWTGEVRFYTRNPLGRTEVEPVPTHAPSALYLLAQAYQTGYLRSHANLFAEDNLLSLPRWPAPFNGFAPVPPDTNKLVAALLAGRNGLL